MEPVIISDHIDRDQIEASARALHAKGYNCVQAVSCAFAEIMGVDVDLCFRLGEGQGGGLATHTETCGALLGGAMVLGLARSHGCADPTSKMATYEYTKKLVAKFEPLYGTTICREIRAQDLVGKNPMKVCKDAVGEAARMTADVLEELAADLKKARAAEGK